jgi:DNA-binding transcriptional regulator YiaG
MTGPELRTIRQHLGLTIVALARELAVSRESIRRWEGREQDVPQMVARIMNVILTQRRQP